MFWTAYAINQRKSNGAAKTIGQIAFGLWPTYGMRDPKNRKGSSPMDIGAAKAIGSIVLDFVGFLVPSTQKSKKT